MINLTNIRVTGLTFRPSQDNKLPTVLVLGLSPDYKIFCVPYDVNEVKETLAYMAAQYSHDIKVSSILLAMLFMLGEDVTEEYLEDLVEI